MPIFGNEGPKSVCILRLSAIGDVCHAIAAVQAIQRQWPETEITWVAGSIEAKLLQGLPGIRIIAFDKKAGRKGYLEIWKKIKGERFDALLHMQAALRASILSLGIRARHKLGFDKVRSKDLQGLFTNCKVKSPASPHVLDGFMQFAYKLGVDPNIKPEWHMPISDQDRNWAQQHIPQTGLSLSRLPLVRITKTGPLRAMPQSLTMP